LVVAALKYAGVPPSGIVAVSVVLLALYYLNLVRTDAAGRELLAGMFQKYVPARSSSTG
jgi:hypothetical protein